MPSHSKDLQRPSLASRSMWAPRRCPIQPALASRLLARGDHQALALERLPGFSRIEEFEDHLASALSSGICVYFDGPEAWLLAGTPLAGTPSSLRIEIGTGMLCPPRFHVLGPGVDASFAIADGALLAGESDRRRIDLIRYWYQKAKPHLIRVWNETRSSRHPVGPIDAA
ncbi:hypothetical protein [Geothrix oryzisoli]|uniref:hypothetical protein n=1 Tax=Geothrix oryzisoli TaxID=2922721 RepID=UPI001FAD16E3|nr:hypothetical protein [Geothrix oryzisoli]